MGSVYNRVRARVYFLTPEEGGRSRNVDLHSHRSPYDLLADLGLGYTEDGFPIRCMARVELEGDPGYIELGMEQTVQIELRCIEGVVVEPGVSFDLSEGAQVVARATVLSVLERVIHPSA
jgi:translation elongation factor EF-Tu-like GTPase